MNTVAIVIPTVGRAHKLRALTENIRDVTPLDRFLPVFVCDYGDTVTITELHSLGAYYVFKDGTYPAKTNAGFRATDQELVLATADDVIFHPGWFDAVVEAFEDPEAAVVGGPDLSPITENGVHVTMPIVRRSYINDPGGAHGERGTVLHEGYHHNWSETELWQLAQHRGQARFVEGCVIEHMHPLWGKGDLDSTYARGAFTNEPEDAALFIERRAQWRA